MNVIKIRFIHLYLGTHVRTHTHTRARARARAYNTHIYILCQQENYVQLYHGLLYRIRCRS